MANFNSQYEVQVAILDKLDTFDDHRTVIGDEWMEKVLTDYNTLMEQYRQLEAEDTDKDKLIKHLKEIITKLEKDLEEAKKLFDKELKELRDELEKEIIEKREKIAEIAELKARIITLEKIISEEGREALLKEIERLKSENATLDEALYQARKQAKDARACGWNSAMRFINQRC